MGRITTQSDGIKESLGRVQYEEGSPTERLRRKDPFRVDRAAPRKRPNGPGTIASFKSYPRYYC